MVFFSIISLCRCNLSKCNLPVFLTTDISPGRQKLHAQIQIDVGELSAHGSTAATFYIFSLAEAEIKLQQRLSYTLDVDRGPGGGGTNARFLYLCPLGFRLVSVALHPCSFYS